MPTPASNKCLTDIASTKLELTWKNSCRCILFRHHSHEMLVIFLSSMLYSFRYWPLYTCHDQSIPLMPAWFLLAWFLLSRHSRTQCIPANWHWQCYQVSLFRRLYTTGWPLVCIYFKGFKPHDSLSSWLVPSTDWSCSLHIGSLWRSKKQQYIAGKIETTLTLSPTSCPAWQYCLSWPYLCGSKCFVAIAENYSGHIVLFGGGKTGFVDYLGKYVLGPRRLNTLFVTYPYYSYLHLSPTYMAKSSPILWD